MLELVDTHTHLDSPEFADDQAEVIQRAVAAGVTKLVTIGASDGFDSAERAIALAEKYEYIWASVGIHPHDAPTPTDRERLMQLGGHPKVVAIGETGLDFFRDWSPKDLQEKWFRLQIEIARELKKPIIIHSRDAGPECLEILKAEQAADVGGVFHCFAENAEFALKLAEINFLVSFPGTLTFKKADSVRAAAIKIPIEQIMLETDAPYMSPSPLRGKRCESSYMIHTAAVLADIKNLSLEEVAKVTTQTACEFYRIP